MRRRHCKRRHVLGSAAVASGCMSWGSAAIAIRTDFSGSSWGFAMLPHGLSAVLIGRHKLPPGHMQIPRRRKQRLARRRGHYCCACAAASVARQSSSAEGRESRTQNFLLGALPRSSNTNTSWNIRGCSLGHRNPPNPRVERVALSFRSSFPPIYIY